MKEKVTGKEDTLVWGSTGLNDTFDPSVGVGGRQKPTNLVVFWFYNVSRNFFNKRCVPAKRSTPFDRE